MSKSVEWSSSHAETIFIAWNAYITKGEKSQIHNVRSFINKVKKKEEK